MGFYIALGYATIPALQAVRIVNERATKSKQMQFIMGMLPTSYALPSQYTTYNTCSQRALTPCE